MGSSSASGSGSFRWTGFNHAEELAKSGHVSVTIDRLGYGSSDHPSGHNSCVGTHATVAHQIVQQLRAGSYGGELHPKFDRVALAGHSLGGSIAQVEAYSFADVDAVAMLSYADIALSASALLTSTSWGPTCLLGGKPSAKGAPGFVFFTHDQADYRKNFLAQAPSDVFSYADSGRSLNPCGDLLSAVPAAIVSGISLNRIKVPVLAAHGRQGPGLRPHPPAAPEAPLWRSDDNSSAARRNPRPDGRPHRRPVPQRARGVAGQSGLLTSLAPGLWTSGVLGMITQQIR